MADVNLIDLANQTQGALPESRITGLVTDLAAKGAIGGVNAKTANYTAVAGDDGKLVSMNGTTLTLTLPASPPSSTWKIFIENINSTALTVSRNGLNIDGTATNLTLNQNQGVVIFTDGSNYFTCEGMGSGGGGGGTAVYGEIASGTVNGSNVTFTLAHTPISGTERVYWEDGRRLRSGGGNDYTISGGTITLANAPSNGAPLVDYNY
ncbi:MAG: hypothetical protein JWO48_1198 [Bryobacterales bacterium]|nr:hypothetical protein [Bryobacterales bacterium]